MKIIFLDIDGVLNSEYYFNKRLIYGERPSRSNLKEYLMYDIDPDCMSRLKTITEATNANIVLSSTWRIHYFEEVKDLLEEYNIKAQLLDKTPRLSFEGSVRGNEIHLFRIKNAQWCGKYWENNDYVIIDDDSDMLYSQKDNFVKTDNKIGLQSKDVIKAIEILNRGNERNI